MPDGSVLPLNVPVTIDHYVVPPTAPLTLVARGTAPSLTFADAGTAKIDVSDIDLHLLLKKSDGTPVGAALGNGPGSVDDGDPNTNDVKCVADAGQPLTLATITVNPPAVDNPPTAPGQPSVSNVAQTSADVSWAASTDDKGVAGYEVYLDGTKVADASGTSTSLTGLTPDTTYSVTVKAKDTAGQLSTASAAASFHTQPQVTVDNPPSKPGTPSVSNITPSSADVTWAASTDDNAVAGYEVYLGGSKVADATTNSVSLSGLTQGTTYSVTVKAKDDAGQLSAASNATSFTTTVPADTSAPTQPGTPSGTPTSSSVALSWGASTDNVGVTGYDVYQNGAKVQTVAGTSATIGGLTASTAYKFKVQAKDAAGNVSPFSSEITVTTSAAPVEQPIAITYAAKGSTYVKGGHGSAPLNGSIAAQMLLSKGTFTADLQMDDTTANLKILGFLPVTARLSFVPVGKTTGSLTNGVMRAHSDLSIKIPVSKAFGFIPIAGGRNCQTVKPASVDLASKSGVFFNPLEGGAVHGEFTLPALKDCGLLTPILSLLTAVPGNTIDLNLTPKA
jgi:chitodextrinase